MPRTHLMKQHLSIPAALCISAVLCTIVLGQSSTASAAGNVDVGSILDSLQTTVQGAAGSSSSQLDDLISQVGNATSGLNTDELSQFASMFQSAKCPIDGASTINAAQVAQVKAACANPPATPNQSFCASCYCAYYQLLLSAYEKTGSAVTAQSGSSTMSDLRQSLSLVKCLSDASSTLTSTLGANDGAAIQAACSNVAATESFAMQVYTQCVGAAASSTTTGPVANVSSSTTVSVPSATAFNTTASSAISNSSLPLTGSSALTSTNRNNTGSTEASSLLRSSAGAAGVGHGVVVLVFAAVMALGFMA